MADESGSEKNMASDNESNKSGSSSSSGSERYIKWVINFNKL